jgi:hypothetical protein
MRSYKISTLFNKHERKQMKNLFLLNLALVIAAPAFASKARLASLQGARQLVDVQTIFINPAHINMLDQYITFEMGAVGTAAEGGFVRKLESGNKLLVYVGHQNPLGNFVVGDVRTVNNYLGQNNPVEVIYGTGNIGFGGSVSTIDDKKNGTKESTVVGKFGIDNGPSKIFAHVKYATAEKLNAGNTDKITAPAVFFGGTIKVENILYFGSVHAGTAKNEVGATATTTDIKDFAAVLAFVDRSMKIADNDIYYGAQVDFVTREVGNAKITGTRLPIFLGMEYNLSSWAIFRGSVMQNFLVGSTKDETITTDEAGIANNATVAAGLGLKYNNLVLDGSLTAATNGQVNGNTFLANAAVTYNF